MTILDERPDIGQADVLTATDAVLRKATVVARKHLADAVVELVFEAADRVALPGWAPGAHVDLVLPSGLVRQYSLCGDPREPNYTVAVLREPQGRGGSDEVHTELHPGTEVTLRGPRNHFPFLEAPGYLFVAGGIGITPMLPMVRRAIEVGADWRMVYGGRSLSAMGYVDVVRALDPSRVSFIPEDTDGRPDLDALLDSVVPGHLIYTCGPGGLLDALQERCGARGLGDRLHLERFGASADTPAGPLAGDQPFDLELAQSGITVHVGPDQSIFDAVQDVAPDLLFSCAEGYCGTCQVQVLDGVPDHRDTVCTPAEHEDEGSMILCVGRAKSARLIIDA